MTGAGNDGTTGAPEPGERCCDVLIPCPVGSRRGIHPEREPSVSPRDEGAHDRVDISAFTMAPHPQRLTYTGATVSNFVDGDVTPAWTPPSDSTFPLRFTTVT